MLTLSIIVAVAQNGVIGFQDKLPWNLPADTAYFRQKIQDRPTLMGRKSYLAPDAEFPKKSMWC
ncbi:MAG: dihydrofolate reductase [Microscillaceae bacterium]|nr:dihydrofolate reductase [Microscillaceae bacterium]